METKEQKRRQLKDIMSNLDDLLYYLYNENDKKIPSNADSARYTLINFIGKYLKENKLK